LLVSLESNRVKKFKYKDNLQIDMQYEKTIRNIVQKYEQFLEPIIGKNSYVGEVLITGLDKILKEELDLSFPEGMNQDFSSLNPRSIPDDFQLAVEELADLRFPHPFEVYTVDELRALYGGVGHRVWNTAMAASKGEGTLREMKDTMVEYRQKVKPSEPSPFRNLGRKTALAMEDYLVFKSGYSK